MEVFYVSSKNFSTYGAMPIYSVPFFLG